jgi:hypothetical protein
MAVLLAIKTINSRRIGKRGHSGKRLAERGCAAKLPPASPSDRFQWSPDHDRLIASKAHINQNLITMPMIGSSFREDDDGSS